MARYTVRVSYIDVLGTLWMPHAEASMRIRVDSYARENMRDDDGHITRESVEDWLTSHAGDFSSVIDFTASIEDGEETIEIPWSSEENECRYLDTLPSEE